MCRRKVQRQPMDGALLVAASIVAAIRLRGEEVKRSPKLTSTIRDSIQLPERVLSEEMMFRSRK